MEIGANGSPRCSAGDLCGVYLTGSGALGGFVPRRSDVGIVAIAAGAPSGACRGAIVGALGPMALRWLVRPTRAT